MAARRPQGGTQEARAPIADMLLIRRFEERAGQLYGMGLIGGFCHLYIGQEAIAVGMQMRSKTGDQVITAYRDHGHMLACGMDPKEVMAELTGRRQRLVQGQGRLDAHVLRRARISTAATASSARRCRWARGSPSPTSIATTTASGLTYFGDGAANQGQVYESFNMAELWRLPVVYVIENNQYAMGTSIERGASSPTSSISAARRSTFRARRSTAWTCWPCKAAGAPASARCRAARARSSWR